MAKDRSLEEERALREEFIKGTSLQMLSALRGAFADDEEEKVGKFNLGDGVGGNCKTGVKSGNGVRLRMVVRVEELNEMVRCEKERKQEKLLDLVRVKGRSITKLGGGGRDNGHDSRWKPLLESIPEDHL